MVARRSISRIALIGLVLIGGAIFHQYTTPSLPKVKNAFEVWLVDFEEDILAGNPREVKVTVALKSRDVNRTWVLNEPPKDDSEKTLVLRVLQLIRDADLLDSTEKSDEFVLVDVAGDSFKKKAILSWQIVQQSLAATNLFVLLENVRPEEGVSALSEERSSSKKEKGSDEIKG